jgi:hypothetical protein
MCFACWITRATAHSKFVILIAFPWQQWFFKRTSVLCCTYIACHVWVFRSRSKGTFIHFGTFVHFGERTSGTLNNVRFFLWHYVLSSKQHVISCCFLTYKHPSSSRSSNMKAVSASPMLCFCCKCWADAFSLCEAKLCSTVSSQIRILT